ncbi:DUF3298 and DUF4163 domain-containing protein [Mucilaginibacter sp.]
MWGVPKKKNSAITTDTLGYTYELIKKRADDCGDKPDSGCTVVKIKYPIFSDHNQLNDTVTKKLTGLFGFFQTDVTLQEMADHFLLTYTNFKKRNKRSTLFYTLNSSAKVLRQDSGLTTLAINSYAFQGGAHGGSYTYFINWDTRNDKNLELQDILAGDYKAKLTQIADTIFRKQEKLGDTTSLANNYFFKGDKFALNSNFLITPIGLRFLYNIYEIKPYAAGRTDLFIPYAKLKPLLRPHTVVTQYIK